MVLRSSAYAVTWLLAMASLLLFPNIGWAQAPVSAKQDSSAGVFVTEAMPMYPGGNGEILRLFKKNIRYPSVPKKQAVQGKVFIRFMVDSMGVVRNPEIVKGLGGFYDQEALRLMSLLERFIPAKDNGSPSARYLMVPIAFTEPEKRK